MTSSCSLRYPALIRSSSVPSSFSFSFSLCSLRSTTPPPLPPCPSLRVQSLLLTLPYALRPSSLPFPLLALFRSPFLPLSNSLSPFLVISPPSLSAFSLRLLSPPPLSAFLPLPPSGIPPRFRRLNPINPQSAAQSSLNLRSIFLSFELVSPFARLLSMAPLSSSL